MKNKKKWLWILLSVIVLAIVAAYFFGPELTSSGNMSDAQAQQGQSVEANLTTTTTIRPATDVSQVSAAGNIELVSQQAAVLQVDGIVIEVLVEVGDSVAAGNLLVALDTTELERAVQRAELNLSSSQAELDKLFEAAAPADIASAEASLASASCINLPKTNLPAIHFHPRCFLSPLT